MLGELFETTMIDPANAIRGPTGRLIDRLIGSSWVVAFRSVRAAGTSRAIIAMADDVGVPLAAMKVLLRSRAPLIVICQHLRSRKAKLLLGRLGLHRRVELFLAMSANHRDVLVAEYHVPTDKIEMLYDTVDHRFFSMDPAIEVRRQIASAGMAARDYKTLIEATRDLDVDVKIEANSAWYSQPLNFASADLHDRIELCNDGTTAGLRKIYAESAVVVVPLQDVPYSAGYSTILEGMSMGKPVVATRIELNGDFIEDSRSGFLVPPGDVGALRERIRSLLDDPALRQTIGRAARERIEAHFSRDIFREKLAASVAQVTSDAPHS